VIVIRSPTVFFFSRIAPPVAHTWSAPTRRVLLGAVAACCLWAAVPTATASAQTKIADDVYLLEGLGAGANVLAVVGPDGVLLVDNGMAHRAPRLDSLLAALGAGPIRYAVNTHFHYDHAGANEHLGRAGAIIVGHELARMQMQVEWRVPDVLGIRFPVIPPYPQVALPQLTFRDRMRLYFGEHEIDLIHLPDAHTGADIVVYIRNRNVLHTGDLCFFDRFPFMPGRVTGTIAAIDSIVALIDDDTRVVPGHGPVLDREALRGYRAMLSTVYERIAGMVAAGMSLDHIVAAEPTAGLSPGESWQTPGPLLWSAYQELVHGEGPDMARVRALTAAPSSPRHEGYADVNGTWLYYQVAGEGEAVVLVHGNGLDRRMWDEQFDVLAREFRVLRYDVRGFGRSALPVPGQRFSHHEDLAALLGTLGIERAHVVGLSMGAGIAADFTLAYPEKTRSLVSAGPWLNGYSSPVFLEEFGTAFVEVRAALAERGHAAALDAWFAAPYLEGSLRRPHVVERMRAMAEDTPLWDFRFPSPWQALRPNAAGRAAEIQVPTLVVTAERDTRSCRQIADLLARTVPGARLVTMADAGHIMNVEHPEEFNRLLLEFLREVRERDRVAAERGTAAAPYVVPDVQFRSTHARRPT
jgi:pimeloyl-ACP methyl ester carboxylesterase/glyoxylase-like metal-dependent hydrolase (beta-lactamase superfamily II)